MNSRKLQIGILLLVFSVLGIVYGARAGLAQVIYFSAKYGAHKEYPRRILRRCEEAHRFYPHNYLFSIWASEQAWYGRLNIEGKEIPERIEASEYWCDTGLSQNFYKSQLRRLKTRLLKRDSVKKAAEYWGEYVDWQFWEPYNHSVLVDLYAEAGDFGKAVKSLEWVKGSKHYDEAKSNLDKAWAKEMAFEPALGTGEQF